MLPGNRKTISQANILGRHIIQTERNTQDPCAFQQMKLDKQSRHLLEYCQFYVLCYFSNYRWLPFWNIKLQNKLKKLYARNVDTIPLRFTHSCLHFATLSNRCYLDWSFLLNFKTTQCENHLDTILIKIHSTVIEILSVPCLVLFLEMAAVLECQTQNDLMPTSL